MKKLALLVVLLLSSSAAACAEEAEEPPPLGSAETTKDTKQAPLPSVPDGGPVMLDVTKVARPVEPAPPPRDEDAGAPTSDAAAPEASAPEPPKPAPAPPAPPTLVIKAPPGGSYEVVTPEAQLCSGDGEQTAFTIRNASRETVEILWLDDSCEPISYGKVQPNGALFFSTYVSHRWRVQTGAMLLGDFVLRTEGSYDVSVR